MNTINYKLLVQRYFLYIFSFSILVFLFINIMLYINDPNQIFHKSFFFSDRLNRNMREQAAGIINNFDFDSIILGTCTLENTSSKEANEKIGGDFVNISSPGSSFFERSFVLRKALKKGLKYVIYSLDERSYLSLAKEHNKYNIDYWKYLYDDNPLNDFIIYYQKDYIYNFYSPYTRTHIVDFDRPNAWYKEKFHYARFGGLVNWVKNIDNPQVHDFLLKELPNIANNHAPKIFDINNANKKIILAKNYIDTYLLNFARDYKSTKFYLIFPPYFRYNYAKKAQHDCELFYIHQEIIRYFVEQSEKLENVFVYGFETDNFLDDISNYKDVYHYHYKFNSYFLDEISHNRHLLTKDNVDNYLYIAKEKALNFDISDLNSKAQSLIHHKIQ